MNRLRYVRRKAGLSQQQLAERSGIPQPTIARIEGGRTRPRLDTLERLLRACGYEIAVAPLSGTGIDRTAMRELLRLSPTERARLATREARNLERAHANRRR